MEFVDEGRGVAEVMVEVMILLPVDAFADALLFDHVCLVLI